MFMDMQHSIQEDIVRWMYRVQLAKPEPQRRTRYFNVVESGSSDSGDGGGVGATPKKITGKIGRNDPCPCGSGKKYKKCCLLKEEAR